MALCLSMRHLVTWLLLLRAACDEVACEKDEKWVEELGEDVLFLQVQQNISHLEEVGANQWFLLARYFKSQMVRHNSSTLVAGEMLQIASSHMAASFGSILVKCLVIGLVIIALIWCYRLFSSSSSSSQKPSSDSSPVGRQRREPDFSQSQVAPIPILCQRYVVPSSESHFSVDMNEVMDPSKSSFAINSASGTKLLEASLSEGRMLSITPVNSKDPEVMLRASSGTADPVMLTITDGRGAYSGKISAGPAGTGVILYHMQRSCASIFADNVSSFSMRVHPLLDETKSQTVASTVRKGNTLKIQVSMNYDGCLFLGCLLGIIVLEPALMQLAAS